MTILTEAPLVAKQRGAGGEFMPKADRLFLVPGTALDLSSYFMHFFQRCFVHFLLALIFLFLSLDAQRFFVHFLLAQGFLFLSLGAQRKKQRKGAGNDKFSPSPAGWLLR